MFFFFFLFFFLFQLTKTGWPRHQQLCSPSGLATNHFFFTSSSVSFFKSMFSSFQFFATLIYFFLNSLSRQYERNENKTKNKKRERKNRDNKVRKWKSCVLLLLLSFWCAAASLLWRTQVGRTVATWDTPDTIGLELRQWFGTEGKSSRRASFSLFSFFSSLTVLFLFSVRYCCRVVLCRGVVGEGRERERLDIPTVTVFRTSSFSYYSLSLSVVAALPSSLDTC